MGYTLIYRSPGGRLAFAALEHDAKTGDGTRRMKARGRNIAEAGAKRGLNRHMPEPTTKSGGLNPPEKEERKEPHARWHRA